MGGKLREGRFLQYENIDKMSRIKYKVKLSVCQVSEKDLRLFCFVFLN